MDLIDHSKTEAVIGEDEYIEPVIPKFRKHKQLSISEQEEILKLYPIKGCAETARMMHIQYERVSKFLHESGNYKPKPCERTIINRQLESTKSDKPIYLEVLKSKRAMPEAWEFCTDYLEGWGNGLIPQLAKKFHITDCTVNRLRDKAQMPLMYDAKHPGYMAIRKRIRKLYTTKNRSTIQIAEIIKTSSQFVQNMLHEMRITMRPQHCVDNRYFKTKSHFSKTKLLDEIKTLYESGMPLKQIGIEVGIWEGTVSSKLASMGIRVRRTGRIEKGATEADCVWCGNHFTIYINVGIKTQIFCNNKCKNKCKDLRRSLTSRMIKGKFRLPYENRYKKLSLEFVGDVEQLRLPDNVKEKVIAWRGTDGIQRRAVHESRREAESSE
jgi:transposase